jgi:hypothetical protein
VVDRSREDADQNILPGFVILIEAALACSM